MAAKPLGQRAEDAERWERKKKRKNPDLGFSGMFNYTIVCVLNERLR